MLLVALQLAAMQLCIWACTLCKILRTSGSNTVLFWTAGLFCSVLLHFIPFCELVPTPSLSALQCVSTSYKGGAGYCKWWSYLENVGTAKVQTLFHCYHPSQPQVCFGHMQITIPSILTYSGPGCFGDICIINTCNFCMWLMLASFPGTCAEPMHKEPGSKARSMVIIVLGCGPSIHCV